MVLVIPETITVHLGAPNAEAENVTVPFIDYIKNVASGEIYPTWPDAAIRANIYAQITFALNRIYNEWYPSQGYDFDITSITQYDQTYAPGREIFANISAIVDEIFNSYVVLSGSVAPYFTAYCNGTTTVCAGLSQWGTVELAGQGLDALAILRYYYGPNIELVEDAPTGEKLPSYPGFPLEMGNISEEVHIIQRQLNRISENFPAIPVIAEEDGIFDAETEAAVIAFQEIFDLPATGIIDKATWYSIKRRYIAVKRLCELLNEGLTISEIERIFPAALREGDTDPGVRALQYFLAFIAYFDRNYPDVAISGNFDAATADTVRYFQEQNALPVNGIVDRITWQHLVDEYNALLAQLPPEYQQYASLIYPGYFLTLGETAPAVATLQEAINNISASDDAVPSLAVTGVYDAATEEAVKVLQWQEGLPANGATGPILWKAVMSRGMTKNSPDVLSETSAASG